MFSKKLSWFLLTSLFAFDAVFSYWAVVYRSAHEANPAIKNIVEAYPLLYFVTIPGLILIMYPIYKGLSLLAGRLFKTTDREIREKIVLTAMVIYWILGNSSVNFSFLAGHRQPAYVWYLTAVLAIIPATIYSLVSLNCKRRSI